MDRSKPNSQRVMVLDSDEFGFSVAIAGDTIVVGARLDDDNGSNSGSAYVFTRTETALVPASQTDSQ